MVTRAKAGISKPLERMNCHVTIVSSLPRSLVHALHDPYVAPRAWFQRFVSFVTRIGFQHNKTDTSLFVFHRGSDVAYSLLYVDDIILTASSTTFLQRIIMLLHGEFAMTDLGFLNYFLGVSAQRNVSGMFLSQSKFAAEILEGTYAEVQPMQDPYISYAVQRVCLYLHDPRDPHFTALKRILRYVRGTIDHGLQLHVSSTAQLTAYTDADWAGFHVTRRSTSGYCVFLGGYGALRHFFDSSRTPGLPARSEAAGSKTPGSGRHMSLNAMLNVRPTLGSEASVGPRNGGSGAKRQVTLSRSSAEAEYCGVTNVVAETGWLRNFLLELHAPLSTATIVYCDNISVVYLSTNPVQHQRTKHIEIDIHFVRDYVASGQVRVLHVPSRLQYANIFTKGLPSALFLDAILGSCSKTIQPIISSVETSCEAWKRLNSSSASSSRLRIISLKSKLTKNLKGTRSVAEFLHEMKSIADELALAQSPILEEDLVVYIVSQLGDEFNNIVAAVKVRESVISFSELFKKLVDFERMLKDSDSSQSTILTTASVTQKSSFKFQPHYKQYNANQQPWLFNSGASHHVTLDPSTLHSLLNYGGPDEIFLGVERELELEERKRQEQGELEKLRIAQREKELDLQQKNVRISATTKIRGGPQVL
nr:ribonuclease H-like domain-containing protein [Tanacetum cinerariifolium]